MQLFKKFGKVFEDDFVYLFIFAAYMWSF